MSDNFEPSALFEKKKDCTGETVYKSAVSDKLEFSIYYEHHHPRSNGFVWYARYQQANGEMKLFEILESFDTPRLAEENLVEFVQAVQGVQMKVAQKPSLTFPPGCRGGKS